MLEMKSTIQTQQASLHFFEAKVNSLRHSTLQACSEFLCPTVLLEAALACLHREQDLLICDTNLPCSLLRSNV